METPWLRNLLIDIFHHLLRDAIQKKREVPERSAALIITILKLEGQAVGE